MILSQAQHETSLGTLFSQWTQSGLYMLSWRQPTDFTSRRGEPTTQAQLLDLRLREFFATGTADFNDIVVDVEGWTPFSRRIYRCCRQIPAGQTTTYKMLARQAGNERASRAVGAAMAKNRIPIVIPCHRVVASSGHLRGFSAPGGLATKRRLLELERQAAVVSVS